MVYRTIKSQESIKAAKFIVGESGKLTLHGASQSKPIVMTTEQMKSKGIDPNEVMYMWGGDVGVANPPMLSGFGFIYMTREQNDFGGLRPEKIEFALIDLQEQGLTRVGVIGQEGREFVIAVPNDRDSVRKAEKAGFGLTKETFVWIRRARRIGTKALKAEHWYRALELYERAVRMYADVPTKPQLVDYATAKKAYDTLLKGWNTVKKTGTLPSKGSADPTLIDKVFEKLKPDARLNAAEQANRYWNFIRNLWWLVRSYIGEFHRLRLEE